MPSGRNLTETKTTVARPGAPVSTHQRTSQKAASQASAAKKEDRQRTESGFGEGISDEALGRARSPCYVPRLQIMQGPRSEPNAAAGAALQSQQMAGERLVNQCRLGLTGFGALTVLSASGAQTRAANDVFLAVVFVLATYAALVWFWLRDSHRH